MEYSVEEIRNKLSEKKLKVTPQRLAILGAIYKLGSHPSADTIIDYIRQSNPNIASGTVYKVLDTLIESRLIKKVTTDNGIMRYDGIMENHHHLYCSECDLIEDYIDEDLDRVLKEFFKKKKFTGFKLENVIVQIRGTFDKC